MKVWGGLTCATIAEDPRSDPKPPNDERTVLLELGVTTGDARAAIRGRLPRSDCLGLLFLLTVHQLEGGEEGVEVQGREGEAISRLFGLLLDDEGFREGRGVFRR